MPWYKGWNGFSYPKFIEYTKGASMKEHCDHIHGLFEVEGKPIINWRAGNYATWVGDTKHFAANIGVEYRYTLQITGHKK